MSCYLEIHRLSIMYMFLRLSVCICDLISLISRAFHALASTLKNFIPAAYREIFLMCAINAINYTAAQHGVFRDSIWRRNAPETLEPEDALRSVCVQRSIPVI